MAKAPARRLPFRLHPTHLHCALLLGGSSACGNDAPAPEPLFPADYAESYIEVRHCRPSGDHDLSPIVVLADPQSVEAYQKRDRGFAEGAILLKAEYSFADPTCQGSIERWTVMVREIAGRSPDTLDWHWQKVDAARNVVTDNERRCIGCHTGCGVPPEGYLGTCTVE